MNGSVPTGTVIFPKVKFKRLVFCFLELALTVCFKIVVFVFPFKFHLVEVLCGLYDSLRSFGHKLKVVGFY